MNQWNLVISVLTQSLPETSGGGLANLGSLGNSRYSRFQYQTWPIYRIWVSQDLFEDRRLLYLFELLSFLLPSSIFQGTVSDIISWLHPRRRVLCSSKFYCLSLRVQRNRFENFHQLTMNSALVSPTEPPSWPNTPHQAPHRLPHHHWPPLSFQKSPTINPKNSHSPTNVCSFITSPTHQPTMAPARSQARALPWAS